MTRLLRAILLAVSLLALTATPAAAAILEADPAVPDAADGSLRQRILAAAAGDTIRLPPGTYRLTQGSLRIEKALTLEGQGEQASQVVVTSEGRGRVILANPGTGAAVTLRSRDPAPAGAWQGPLPHARPLQLRHRAGHDLDDQGSLRRDNHARPERAGAGP